MPDANYFAATVEDCDSDTDEAIGAPTFDNPPFEKPHLSSRNATLDAASDSGYSSRTAATLGSAASLDISKKPATTPDAAPASTGELREPTASGKPKRLSPAPRPVSRTSSKVPSRPTSRSTSQRMADGQYRRCSDPACDKCTMRRRPAGSPLESPWQQQYPRSTPSPLQASPYAQSAPYPYHTTASYQPVANVPVVAPPQPRRRTPGSTKPRPQSYHPGVAPDGYWVPITSGPKSPYETGPPPAPSAYANHQSAYSAYAQPQPSPSATLYPPHSLPYTQPSPTSLRPSLTQRSTDTYVSRPRPTSTYGAMPQAAYEHKDYSGALVRRQSASRYSQARSPHDPYYYNDMDRQRMPPPPRPAEPPLTRSTSQRRPEKSQRRPSDYYDRYSDSSNSDRDATVRAEARPTRPTAVSGKLSYERKQNSAKEYIETVRDNHRPLAPHESSTESYRRGSTESESYNDQLRRSRPTSRSRRLTEGALARESTTKLEPRDRSASRAQSHSRSRAGTEESNSSKSGVDGFKIEVDRQGTVLNVNGQRISVMPKEGGTAELIIGGQKHEVKYVEDEKSQSSHSGSARRKSRSSTKSSSEVGATTTNTSKSDTRTASRSSRKAAVSNDDEKPDGGS